jgi:integrase
MNWAFSSPRASNHSATVMIENGVPLKIVSEILGHFSVSITGDIYGHVSPDVSAQAMDVLGAALDG